MHFLDLVEIVKSVHSNARRVYTFSILHKKKIE